MFYTRSALINKVILSDATDLNGKQAQVSLYTSYDDESTVTRSAVLSLTEGKTLTARFTDSPEQETLELISPLYNNYYAHRFNSLTIN